jgi:hypothetical protein
VLLLFGSANRDERVFAHPDVFAGELATVRRGRLSCPRCRL